MEGFVGIGVAVAIAVVAFIAILGTWANRYRKVGPEEVLIVSGRKRKIKKQDGTIEQVGFRVVRNGGAFVWPVLEKVSSMSLHSRQIAVATTGAMSKEGVEINVKGTALIKVASDDVGIANAAERFLGKDGEIDTQVKSVLDGSLRGVCGTLTPEEIYRDRNAFQTKITEQVQHELGQMGLVLDVLTLQDISDDEGYFASIGKKRTAEVKREARIGEADANRDATMKEAEAQRDSDMRVAETQAQVADAEKARDVKKAQYDAETHRERATAEQAGPISKAKAEQEVAQAMTDLAKKRATQREEELVAEIVKPAEADKRRMVLQAEADRDSRKARAEADNFEKTQEGLGEAERIRSVKVAEADGIKAIGEAEAEAIKAKLLAEAEGWEKRAVAMKQYSDAAMAIELGQRLIDKMPEMIAASASALGGIDKLEIFDFGGNGHATSSLMGIAPKQVLETFTWLKQTTGVDVAGLLKGVQTQLEGGHSNESEGGSVEESPRPRHGEGSEDED